MRIDTSDSLGSLRTRLTAHAGARRWQLGQSSSNQNAEGNTKKDAVERKAKAHAHRNAHADGRLTFLALRSEQSAKEQVGSPMQSSTFY